MFEGLTYPYDDIANWILAFAAIVFALSYAWTQLRRGTNEANAEAANAYKLELDAVKVSNERLQRDIDDLKAQVNQLIGENREKEKKVKELQDLLALRNPEFMDTMKALNDMMDKFCNSFNMHDRNALEIKKEQFRQGKVLDKVEGHTSAIDKFCKNEVKKIIANCGK